MWPMTNYEQVSLMMGVTGVSTMMDGEVEGI